MSTDPEFEKIYRAAQESFDDQRFDEAERLYLKLLDRDSRGYADVFNRMGLISIQKGLYERAAQYFEKALAINPKYTDASLNLVVTYNELRRFDDAERVFNQAARVVRAEPASMDPFIQGKLANEHGKLGDAYYELGRYDQALDEYQKAAALRPKFVDILTKIGMTLREMGEMDRAVAAFDRAKQAGPGYVPIYIHLGITYYTQGRRDLAFQEWKSAQKIDPSNRAVPIYLNMARKP